MKPRHLAIALAILHLVLAWTYASITPYRQEGAVLLNRTVEKDIGAPDERQHANYVTHLREGKGFPIFDPKDPNLYESYQSHQPPLFYVVAAATTTISGVSDLTARDAGLRVRWINGVFGALTVFVIFLLGSRATGSELAGVGGATFAALLPMHTALSGALSNDPLLILLCSIVLLGLTRALRDGWTTRNCTLIGLTIGAALLTKTSAMPLLVASVAALVVRRAQPAQIAGLLGLPVLIAIPWWIRSTMLYGDPLALRAFSEAFVGSAQKQTFVTQIIPQVSPGANPELTYWTEWVGFWTMRSFFGVFGYMDIWLTESGRAAAGFDQNRLYIVLILWAMVGWIAWAVGKRQTAIHRPEDEGEPGRTEGIGWVYFVFTAVVFVLFLRFNNQYFQAQARYLFPALGPIAVALGAGYAWLLRRATKWLVLSIALPLVLAQCLVFMRLPGTFQQRIDVGIKMKQLNESSPTPENVPSP
jgi:4-amino-4-deoxy-L-arabinose transferase-like glycosyltransferase